MISSAVVAAAVAAAAAHLVFVFVREGYGSLSLKKVGENWYWMLLMLLSPVVTSIRRGLVL